MFNDTNKVSKMRDDSKWIGPNSGKRDIPENCKYKEKSAERRRKRGKSINIG